MAIDKDKLRSAAQVGLLGAISPGILAVWVDATGTEIQLKAYADRQLSEDERDEIEAAGTETIAAFPEATWLDVEIEGEVQPPLKYPGTGWWVFVRYGCSVNARD
jgi:hypothetical protein